jgi:hypothetical protein
MLFNDTLDHGEAQSGPHAEFFGGEKRLEDLRDGLLRNSVARVGYRQLHPVLLRRQSNTHRSPVRHRMDGVHDQVDHDLAHLIRVGQDLRTAVGPCHFCRDTALRESLLKQLQAVVDDVLQRERTAHSRVAPRKREQLVHQLCDPFDLRDDRRETLLGWLVRGAIPQIFRTSENDVHRRPDFMRHAGG